MSTPLPRAVKFLVLAAGLALAASIGAEPTAYVVEAEFLATLSTLGLHVAHGGFESAAWDGVRTSIAGGVHTAPSVSSHGLVWTANNLSSAITTSERAARTGQYGVYSCPHGSDASPDPGTDCYLPGDCGDGDLKNIFADDFSFFLGEPDLLFQDGFELP